MTWDNTKPYLQRLTSAHLSTNGDRVALTARGQVFVAPVKQGRVVEVTRNGSVRYRNARFASTNSLTALSDQSGELEFWHLPVNGLGAPEQVTDTGKVFRYDGVVSPNQNWLAYSDKDFRLLVWTNRPRVHTQIRSDINYRIERLFRQAGIEIPFPQTELRLRGRALHLDRGDRLVADDNSGDVEPLDRIDPSHSS